MPTDEVPFEPVLEVSEWSHQVAVALVNAAQQQRSTVWGAIRSVATNDTPQEAFETVVAVAQVVASVLRPAGTVGLPIGLAHVALDEARRMDLRYGVADRMAAARLIGYAASGDGHHVAALARAIVLAPRPPDRVRDVLTLMLVIYQREPQQRTDPGDAPHPDTG